jgi:DNA polymerase-4
LLGSGRAARTVTVKIRRTDFATHTRSETAALATTDLTALTAVAQRLARGAVPDGGVRLIGVSLAGLGDEPPPGLFDETGWAGDADHPADAARFTAEPDGRGAGVSGQGLPQDGAAERDAPFGLNPTHPDGAPPLDGRGPSVGPRAWQAGDDVHHLEYGHGWVQGAGHGRVTVRFETRSTGPGRARTLVADDPALGRADPLGSLR